MNIFNRNHKNANLLTSVSKKLLVTTAITAAGFLSLTNHAHAQTAPAWNNFTDIHGTTTTDTTSVPNTTLINQHSQTYIGNSPNLDILAAQTVVIGQNNTGSLFVARAVGGSDPTRILGSLKTVLKDASGNFTNNLGGTVMVNDSNGVIFGVNSRVDVGGIIASTGYISDVDITDEDGEFTFTNMTDGEIINRGIITVAEGGVAAFVSPYVTNNGTINARLGKVAFAAGEKVTLDLYGDNLIEIAVEDDLAEGLITNTANGEISAEGGTVHISAQIAKDVVDSVINMNGVVNVASATVKGGKIILSGGTAGKVAVRKNLNASGAAGQDAGSIEITGHNIRTFDTATIKADAEAAGAAGDIIIVADRLLTMDSELSAQGTDGTGFIETSAPVANFGANASILATKEWLLDPTDILIDAALGNLIENQLTVGDSTVQTPAGGADEGDIGLRTFINWNSDKTFKIIATDDAYISTGGGIASSGTGNFVIEAGDDVRLRDTGGSIFMNGGDVTITAGDEFTLEGGSIDAGGGDITINNTEQFEALAGSIITSGNGKITLNQNKDVNGNTSTTDATIQNAIDAIANSGTGVSKVNVGEGIWAEAITIDKAITVRGAGRNNTTVTPGAGQNGFTIDGVIDGEVRIARLGVDGGSTGIIVNQTADLEQLTINKTLIQNNAINGVTIRENSVGSTTIKNSDFVDNGLGGSIGGGGDGDILFFRNNGDITLSNLDIQGNDATNAADYGIQIRGADIPAASGVIEIDDVTVSGDYRAGLIGIQRYDGVDLTMTDVTLGGTTDNGTNSAAWGSLYLSELGANDIDLGNTSFDAITGQYITTGVGATYNTTNNINATAATFEGVAAADLTTEQSFAVEDKVFHKMDLDAQGLVTWQTGNLFVTQASNDFDGGNGIQRAVDTSDVGGNVWVDNGTFAESVNVNKTVNLYGNNYGISGSSAARIAETIVTPNSPGFYVTADDVVIDGFTVDGSGGAGNNGIETDGINNFTAENNILTGNTDTPAARAASGYKTGIGILVNDTTGTILISDNNASNNTDGIRVLDSDAAALGDIIISNNTSDNNTDKGIIINRSDFVEVSDNTITGNKTGIWIEASSENLVEDNDINDSAENAIRLRNSDDNTVNDNDIDVAQNGVFVESSNDVTVSNNEIDDITNAGIHSQGSDDTQIISNFINDNGASSYTDYGILVEGGSSVDVDGNKIEETSITGIAANNTTFIDIDDNLVKDGADGIRVEDGRNADIRRNETRDMSDDGIQIISHNNVDIEENIVKNSDDSGIVVAGSDNANIDNNNVDVARNGIRVRNSDDATISNNEIDDAVNAAIFSQNSDDVQITSNFINDNGASSFVDYGILVEGGNSVDVDDNKIEETSITGIAANNTTFIDIDDNLVKDGADGIRVEDGRNADIRRNETRDMSDDGIQVVSHNNADIEENIVKNSDDSGIVVADSENVNIDNNNVDVARNGIRTTRSDDAFITTNTVDNITENGVLASRSDFAFIVDNTINNTGDDAIDLNRSDDALIGFNNIGLLGGVDNIGDDGIDLGSSDNAIITDNNIQNTVENGIDISNSHNAGIEFNTIRNTGENGIYASLSDNVRIIENVITDTSENGILAEDGNDIRVRRNTLRRTGNNGIEIKGNDFVRVTNNIITNTDRAGIIVKGAKDNVAEYAAVIAGNTVRNIGNTGIVLDRFTTARVVDNVIRNTNTAGMRIESGDEVRIRRNDVRNTGRDGIYGLDLADADLRRNDVRNADWDGINLSGSDNATLINNDIRNSDGDGIEVSGFGQTTVELNEISNSGEAGLNVSGPDNGDVIVSENTFTENDIGAQFESGVIDLTGEGNIFDGGRVGMRFSLATPAANLSLVDDDGAGGFGGTIGAQTFDGQSGNYVELDNGALFAPGSPTPLNALDSTYVETPFGEFTPSVDYATGFPLDVAAYLESKFFHFNDGQNLGLFLFPLLPEIDQEDVLRFFGANANALSGLNITLLGLPGIPGGPVALNNITPAAGDGTDGAPASLNAIETAAGDQETTCWGDAVDMASSGPVSLSYSGTAEDLLSGEASCGS